MKRGPISERGLFFPQIMVLSDLIRERDEEELNLVGLRIAEIFGP